MAESEAGRGRSSFVRTPSRNRSIALWAAALVTIILGFADLARGGTTIAPVLLVVGYCILVPIAILK
jgi:hypothetical protein